MRQYIIVTVIIFALVCTAYGAQELVHRQIEDFDMKFTQLETMLQMQNDPKTKAFCIKLVEQWDQKRELWEVFIDHASLDEAQTTVYELKGYVLCDAPQYLLQSSFCKLYADLVQIDMQTRLTLGHLF